MSNLFFTVNSLVWQGCWLLIVLAAGYVLFFKKITSKRRFLAQLLVVFLLGFILSVHFSPMHIFSCALVDFFIDGFFALKNSFINILIIVTAMIIFNKCICSWVCHFGAFQEILFFLSKRIKKYKLSFWLTNSIRIVCFFLILFLAVGWGLDLVCAVDPFYIFSPREMFLGSGFMSVFIVILSFFVYRPWCQLFCPFGLIGWLLEKISIFKIRVNHKKCIDCGACINACPTQTMVAILNKNKIIPDCWSCGCCLNSCPTKAITFDNRNIFWQKH
jgi:polyferredoxin